MIILRLMKWSWYRKGTIPTEVDICVKTCQQRNKVKPEI